MTLRSGESVRRGGATLAWRASATERERHECARGGSAATHRQTSLAERRYRNASAESRSSCLCVPPVTKRNGKYVSNDRAKSSTVGQAAGFQADSRVLIGGPTSWPRRGASSLQACYSAVMNNFATILIGVSKTLRTQVSRTPSATYT